MRKTVPFLFATFLFFSCNDKKNIPDVSGVEVTIKMERFDKDFFSLDTTAIDQSLASLEKKYPTLLPLFLQNILGLDRDNLYSGTKQFIRLTKTVEDSVTNVYANTESLQKEFKKGFQFVKHYFPSYKVPSIVTVVGPLDALAQTSGGYSPDFLGDDFLGISLQFYLGQDYSIYKDPFFIQQVAPAYRSRRFSKEYIVADAMQIIVDDIFPDSSSTKSLIEQMIEKGKQWWMLDKFLPETPDSIKTGYSQQQLNWCKENEGLIWSYLLKSENLNSLNPETIQTYIGEGPFTQGFSQELSPGNLGQWVGWRIVQKYADRNTGMKPEEIMRTPAKKILDESRYKPK